MTLDSPRSSRPQPADDSLDTVRGYLLHLAEQYVDPNLQAKASASDLVHETLLVAHSRRDQYKGQSGQQFKGWLRQILLNVIRKFRRHWRREIRNASREVSLDDPAAPLPSARPCTPSWLLSQEDGARRLACAVASLPEEQRSVVLWRIEEELPFAEIGVRLEKSADAVRMIFHRALERLQKRLADETAEDV